MGQPAGKYSTDLTSHVLQRVGQQDSYMTWAGVRWIFNFLVCRMRVVAENVTELGQEILEDVNFIKFKPRSYHLSYFIWDIPKNKSQ